jgi:hypothetical protein
MDGELLGHAGKSSFSPGSGTPQQLAGIFRRPYDHFHFDLGALLADRGKSAVPHPVVFPLRRLQHTPTILILPPALPRGRRAHAPDVPQRHCPGFEEYV